jgi:hypothetical protein
MKKPGFTKGNISSGTVQLKPYLGFFGHALHSDPLEP